MNAGDEEMEKIAVSSQPTKWGGQVLHYREDGGKQKNNLFFSDASSMLIPEKPPHCPALRFPYAACTQRPGKSPPPPQHYLLAFPFFLPLLQLQLVQ